MPTPKHYHRIAIAFLAIFLILLACVVGRGLYEQLKTDHQQAQLQPFYDTPAGFESAHPGQVLRQEPMDIEVPAGGRAVRVLYRSQDAAENPTVTSGIIFLPAADSDVAERPVVAWAHGTIGLGDDCAPSRTENPATGYTWLGGMLERGWVVAATDYAGLGTAGQSQYLIGGSEARDVLNSVRAARNVDAKAGNRFAVFGLSQGGHSALWTGTEADRYAPELALTGTAAAAPAAELPALLQEQFQSAASWVIGPDVAQAWPTVYPNLDLTAVINARNLRKTHRLSEECVERSGSAALVRHALGESFFTLNPVTVPSWNQATREQTPPPSAADHPTLIIQSLSDQVVLANTTAALVQRSCLAGSDIQTLWLAGIMHQQTANTAGPSIVEWLGDRFEGKPTSPTCSQPLPLIPAADPAP